MSARVPAWLAWSLCVALAVASLILALLNGRTLGEIFLAWSPSIGALATWTVSFSVVGALVASHRPENPIGWIFLAIGFFYGLLSAGDLYAIYALLTNPGALPLGAEASWLGQWIWAPGLGLILVFLPLLFPDGHPPSHRWRPVGWLGGLSIGLICVLTSIVLWPERGPALVRPGGFPEFDGWRYAVLEGLVSLALQMMMFLAGLGAVISLLVRFRWAGGTSASRSNGSPPLLPCRSSGYLCLHSWLGRPPSADCPRQSSPCRFCLSFPRSPSLRASPSC